MLCWQVSDHMDIFLNQLIQFYLNKTINLRHLTQRIIPTKWRSYRYHRLRDVISPYVYRDFRRAVIFGRHRDFASQPWIIGRLCTKSAQWSFSDANLALSN